MPISEEESKDNQLVEKKMHYSEYKNNYANCDIKPDSYNQLSKTIVVYVEDKKEKKYINQSGGQKTSSRPHNKQEKLIPFSRYVTTTEAQELIKHLKDLRKKCREREQQINPPN